MRPSYGKRIAELESIRRREAYGARAKVLQLKVLLGVCALLYVSAKCYAWFHPKSPSLVLIDDVLIEVVEDDNVDRICYVLALCFGGGVAVAAMLKVLPLLPRAFTRPDALASNRVGREARNHYSPVRSAVAMRPSVVAQFPPSSVAVTAPTSGLAALQAGGCEARRPPLVHAVPSTQTDRIDSRAALDTFISSTMARRTPPATRGDGAPVVDTLSSIASGALGPGAATQGLRVQYRAGLATDSSGGTGSHEAVAGAVEDMMWTGLGVLHVERSLLKIREWVSGLCQKLVNDIVACDRWCAERRISSYDCSHSLQEPAVNPTPAVPPPATGWGFGAAATQAPQQSLKKIDELLAEKQKLASHSQHIPFFDEMMCINRRLLLEQQLDISSTFRSRTVPASADLQSCQMYIIRRFRTLAMQQTLGSYSHAGGDPDTWREGFPADAYLLAHLIRVSVGGFSNYITFPHEWTAQKQELAILIGDTGEPYFYVRHKTQDVDKTYATHKGSNSLFEALLIFAAIVRSQYHSKYGGIWGVVDLERIGLHRVL